MTPEEFIDDLSVHFGKRHADERAERVWIRDMVAVVKRTDSKVLERAYEMVLAQHDERAFPLPAVLRRFIERAAAELNPPPEHRVLQPENDPVLSADELARRKSQVAELVAKMKSAIAEKNAEVDRYISTPDVSRQTFTAMQQASSNPIHRTPHGLTELSKRMTGEQE